jgi:hypothetical protein
MIDKLRGRVPRFLTVIIAGMVALACGVYFGVSLLPPGERLGGVPDGYLSHLVWHQGYLYFLREAAYIDAMTELWRVKPGGKAERVSGQEDQMCSPYGYTALAERPDGKLALVQECDRATEILTVSLDPLTVERVAEIPDKQGEKHVLRRITWVGDVLFASRDGLCGSIARIDGGTLTPVPPLETMDGPLDVGSGFLPDSFECPPFPVGGFVTPVGDVAVFLAPREQIGRSYEERHDVEYVLYRTTAEWRSGTRIADGFDDPERMAAVDDCGLLIAAERGWSNGIWFVGADGQLERVLRGRYGDFAVQPGGDVMAVLGSDGDADSLRLVRHPFEGKEMCAPGERF